MFGYLLIAIGFGFLFRSVFLSVFDTFFKPEKETIYEPDKIININHITENHLHISKEDLNALINSKKGSD